MSKKTSNWYVDVAPAVPLPSAGPAQTYTYSVKKKIPKHSIVDAPFGRRSIRGVVVNIHQQKPAMRVKNIEKSYEFHLTPEQIEFGKWIARTMQGGLGFTLRLFVPPSIARAASAKKRKPNAGSDESARALVGSYADRIKKIQTEIKKFQGFGKQVAVVVPEVWMIERLARDLNGVPYHAGLAGKPQAAIWNDVASGKAVCIIGTQKTLFLPFTNLGAIIVEEESSDSHKLWDQYPRLDTRVAAKELAQIHNSALIWTATTPSLALWDGIRKKEIKSSLYRPSALPSAVYAFTPEDRQARHLLPSEASSRLHIWAKSGQRICILYNRRGSWQAARCRSCNKSVSCKKCGVTMAVHGMKSKRKLVCHSCGKHKEIPKSCPACKKASLKFVGIGGEIMEQVVRSLLPKRARVVRIDADTLKANSTKVAGADVLIGTTSLLKTVRNHSFDQVVWLLPEQTLSYPDFRSYERGVLMLGTLKQLLRPRRTITLITKRQSLINEQLVQPLQKIYTAIMKERRRFSYPPIADFVRLTCLASSSAKAEARAIKVRENLESKRKKNSAVIIRGPYKDFRPLRRGKYQSHLALLGPLSELTDLYDTLPIDIVDVAPQRVL